jgi:hypothetical protein
MSTEDAMVVASTHFTPSILSKIALSSSISRRERLSLFNKGVHHQPKTPIIETGQKILGLRDDCFRPCGMAE